MSASVSHDLDRIEQELHDAEAARPQDAGRLAAALEAAIGVTRSWPEAAEFVLSELLGELSEVYETLDRPADALRVMAEAIAAGYAGAPDPRCRLAEIHLRSGNPEPAHRIFAEVRVDSPDDVWLYNNAGLEYGHAGDHPRALDWLTEGLELALRTGDPEQLVAQLSDLRRASLRALGYEHDDLERRADAFLAAPPALPRRWPTRADLVDPPAPTPRPRSEKAMVALAWFPAEEFPLALQNWPELAETLGTTDHRDYCRSLQRHLLQIVDTQPAEARSLTLSVAPIQISAYLRWCAEREEDAGELGTRARYAAECARTGTPEMIAWPPGRNQPCWCGSARKYKQCCGPVRLDR